MLVEINEDGEWDGKVVEVLEVKDCVKRCWISAINDWHCHRGGGHG